MKNVDDMTNKEAVEELNNILLDYVPSGKYELSCPCNVESKLLDLSNIFECEGSLFIEMLDFTAVIIFTEEEGVETYEITANLISADFFNTLYEHRYDEYITLLNYARYRTEQPSIDARCATFTLEQIQEELTDEVLQDVFKGHHVVSFKYLLANPRKEVVEWALKHKDELGFRREDASIAEQYQAIPELRELILKTL